MLPPHTFELVLRKIKGGPFRVGLSEAEIQEKKMAARNVLIRGIYGDYTHWSRVSMGRLEDVKRYVKALPAVLDEMNA